jgi:hypothetical protein
MTPTPRKSNNFPHSPLPTIFLCREENTGCGAMSREEFSAERLTDQPHDRSENYARCHADERSAADSIDAHEVHS